APRLGVLHGACVKGPPAGGSAAHIDAAIRLHRRIDVFTAAHPAVLAARARFPAERRRASGILLDLFFDHCLAQAWDDYASESLPHFTRRVYQVLGATPELPGHLALIAPRMAAQDWLGSYRDVDTLPRVVDAMRR